MGLASTLAIAFVCAKWINFDEFHSANREPCLVLSAGGFPRWECVLYHQSGALQISALNVTNEDYSAISDSDTLSSVQVIPRWTTLRGARPAPDSHDRLFHARGWPMLAFWCEFPVETGIGHERGIAGGIDLRFPRPPPPVGGGGSGPLRVPPALPLRPIGLGLLVDTAAYGVAWFALFRGINCFARWSRRRNACCPNCGYDLRGAAHDRCPECGTLTQRQPRASPPAKLGV